MHRFWKASHHMFIVDDFPLTAHPNEVYSWHKIYIWLLNDSLCACFVSRGVLWSNQYSLFVGRNLIPPVQKVNHSGRGRCVEMSQLLTLYIIPLYFSFMSTPSLFLSNIPLGFLLHTWCSGHLELNNQSKTKTTRLEKHVEVLLLLCAPLRTPITSLATE